MSVPSGPTEWGAQLRGLIDRYADGGNIGGAQEAERHGFIFGVEVHVIAVRRIQKGEFQLYKSIRLESLLDSPTSFSAKYEEALQRTDESWQTQSDSLAIDSDKCSFIAFHGQTPIGISSLYKTSEYDFEIELMQVWVSPAYRGKGVAKRIFASLESWAKEKGFSRIFLHSKRENSAANSYYKKIGFAIKEVGEAEYLMEKSITGEFGREQINDDSSGLARQA